MRKKIILFELNEVPLRIIDHFCHRHPESTLARVLPRCRQFETYTEDRNLSPWTTWPTLHRGVLDRTHTIHHFGQDLGEIDEEFPAVWQVLSRNGIRTGVCGSLHSYPLPADLSGYVLYLPDTFAAGTECLPTKLQAFQAFNLAMARDSGRVVDMGIHWGRAIKMLATAPGLGFTRETAADIAWQLIAERVQGWRRIRRRTYQVVLAFDVFMEHLRTTRADFSTFFTNHVASSMHRYWAAAFPGDYERFEFDARWVATYRHEIDFTMRRFDRFLRRLVQFVERTGEHALWIATSMGQAATVARPVETKLMLMDPGRFMARLGFGPEEWTLRPAMVPQTNVVLFGAERAARFRAVLPGVSINGAPVPFEERERGFFSVTIEHENVHDRPRMASLGGRAVSFSDLGLEVKRIDDKCGATAYHVPQGALLVYDPANRPSVGAARATIPTTEIAPALLRHFGVRVPGYMRDARRSELDSVV